MFRALKEAFDNPASTHKNFVESQRNLYYEQLPNMIITSDSAYNTIVENGNKFKKAVSFADPVTKTLEAAIESPASYFRSGEIPQAIKDKHQYCLRTPQDVLATAQNPGQKLRCGWLYSPSSNGKDAVSTGFLGTSRGPLDIFSPPNAKWYWNIGDAEKDQNIDLCRQMKRCEDVDKFAGKCAYCPSNGQGIPINQGIPRYPNDSGCMNSSLITASNKCTVPISPPQGSPASEIMQLEQNNVCQTLTNGTISRQCLMKNVLDAKCSRDGALYTALATSLDPSNYIGGLIGTQSYNTYQTRSQSSLPQDALKNGKLAADIALRSFTDLYTSATATAKTAVTAAARDLCFKKGEFASFDFCTELLPTTTGPFSLECLQKEFKFAGGQPAGNLYPTNNTLTYWNSQPTWGSVRARIMDLATATKSSDEATQTAALQSFLGIKREINDYSRIGIYNMYDTLWFLGNNIVGRTSDRVLYGRRLYSSDLMPGLTNYRGDLNGLPFGNDTMMILMATMISPNDRIKWRMTTDDGAIITMNRFMPSIDEWESNKIRNEPSIFSRWYRQPPTTHNSTDMEIIRNKPNYMKIAWNQGMGGAIFDLTMESNGEFKQIPPEQLLLNQEPDAPYVSFETRMRSKYMNNMLQFQEYRNPEFFYFNRMENVQYESIQSNYVSSPGSQPFIKLNPNSFIQLGTSILPVAWKTITIAFRLDNALPSTVTTLFHLGKIIVELKYIGTAIYAFGIGERIPIQLEQNLWYLLTIIQNPNDRRITMSITPFNSKQPTTINIQLLLDQGFTKVNSAILNQDAGLLEIGGISTPQVSIAWIHIFDRIFNTSMINKELSASWARAYM
jgi:hypothetical protein